MSPVLTPVLAHLAERGRRKITLDGLVAATGHTRKQCLRAMDKLAADVLLMEAPKDGGWRTVQKQKIQVKPGRYSNAEGLLAPHEGKQVYVKLDPTDLSRVCVYALNQATGLKDFVCWAVDPSLPGGRR